MKKTTAPKGFLGFIERTGNALPHPASLFAILAALALLFSWIGHVLDWHTLHPATGELIDIENLLSKNGLHRIMLELVHNYTGFAPLGIVMVALLGIGIAESSGLINVVVRGLLLRAHPKTITFFVVFAGIVSNVASDLGYVVVIPIGAVIFHSLGRHPVAGMAAAFAGVSGGFSANLFIGTIDPLLAGLSTEAAHIIDPAYTVLPTANYYFMVVSTVVLSFTGAWVTNKIVEPRLGKYSGAVEAESFDKITPTEKKALLWVGISFTLIAGLVFWGLYPDHGFLRGPDNTVFTSPVLKGFVAFLFISAAILGIVYGAITGSFKTDRDVINGMVDQFKSLASFLVLVFFAAQFVAFFKWSNLGLLIAVDGAHVIQNSELGLIPLIILFILLSGFINMFMGSASAKWAILGPVFIPIFMLLGYSPELSQVVFRVGDSVTNIISPMMSFFALIIVYFEKYVPKAGVGTLISTMLPYSIAFFVIWTILLILWVVFELPLGPGSELFYQKIHI